MKRGLYRAASPPSRRQALKKRVSDSLLYEGTKSMREVTGRVRQVVAALILRDGKFLICQRTQHQPMALKWEFPGGKIETGEQPRDALRRELEEEIGIDARIGDEVERIQHTYKTGSAVELRFFAVPEYRGEIENRIFRDVQWVERERLTEYDFVDADLQLVRDLAAGKIL
jgi:8-oxo-dGTP diphosphatase